MTIRRSLLKTSQREVPPRAAVLDRIAVPAPPEDFFDGDDTLILTYPDEATAQGATETGETALYFKVDAEDMTVWGDGASHSVRLSLHYLDEGTETLTLEYSSNGTSANQTKTLVTKTDTGEWKWKPVHVSNMRLGHSVYASFDNADFRVYSNAEVYANAARLRETAAKIKVNWKADQFDDDLQDQTAFFGLSQDLVGPWEISEDYLIFDTGANAESMGMSPEDYPFYSGATYANRASAPFRVDKAGGMFSTSGQIAHWDVGVVNANTISTDNGKIQLSSGTPPFISLGNTVTGVMGGAGIWMGKDASAWKFRVGDPSGAYVLWDDTDFTIHNAGLEVFNGASQTGNIDKNGSGWFGSSPTNKTLQWWSNGGNAGDVRMGGTGHYALWDDSAGTFTIDGDHSGGTMAGWTVTPTQISADNGKAVLNAATPFISLGNLVNGYMNGKGFWVGKHAGDWKFHMGDPAAQVLYWDGANLYDTGKKIGGQVGGLDVTSAKIYIGAGNYNNADTAFYVDNTGQMSLKDKLTWDGTTLSITGTVKASAGEISGSLLVTGTLQSSASANLGYKLTSTGFRTWNSSNVQTVELNANGSGWFGTSSTHALEWTTAGVVKAGGFVIGADSLGDAADSFGLASTATAGNDVRFWAGAPFASRASAPLQIYEDGFIFAKDIVLAKGSLSNASGATGYGYAVDPLFLCHYDGPFPFSSDFRGSAIGHKGQVETRAGGVVFRRGMFGKAIQIAEGTTNKVKNPSAENTGNFAARGTASVSRVTGYVHHRATSYQVTLAAANDGIDLTLAALANAFHYVTFWVTGTNPTTYQVSLDGTNWNMPTLSETDNYTDSTATWRRYGVQISAAQANGSTTLRLRNTASSGTQFIDEVQVEQKSYPTPYGDGSMDGHAWSGTADASDSTRTAASLTYPASGNINLAQGTISFWFYMPTVHTTPEYDFACRIDANNQFNIRHIAAAAKIPGAQAISGGVTAETFSGASTASADAWHHICVTWTAGALKCYLDGAQSGATGNYVAPVGTPTTIEIGSNALVQQCNSLLDDVAILPVVLTANEIKSIYYSTAPLMLGVSNQELRLSGAGLGEVFGNANGLFGRGADGSASFGILNGSVNATVWGGSTAQSETFDSGDFMFGSNASGKANLVWDASAGASYWRVGTTKKVSIDTSGMVLVGSNVAAAATTSIGVFSTNGTSYNSETFDAGDMLFGDSSSGKSNMLWDASAGASYWRVGTTKKVSIDTNGTLLLGSDVSSPTTTRFAFFSGSVSYNSESVAAGDMILGNNSASKANVFYDNSSGRLKFRAGTITNIYIDTDGAEVFLAEVFPASSYLKWKDSSNNLIGQIAASYSVGNSGSIVVNGYGRNSGTPAGVAALQAFRYDGANVGILAVYSDNAGASYVDSNDQQALIRSDASAQDDDGWVTAAVDYGEYIEKADHAEEIEVGDLVFISGRKASKRGGGTAMVVSTYAGIRGGDPLHWSKKWIPEREYTVKYGEIPPTIWAWAKKHSKPVPFEIDHRGERKIRPRYCSRQKADGRVVLNPEWDFAKGFVPRSNRPGEWIVIAFSGQVYVNVHGAVREGDYILPSGKADGYGYAIPASSITLKEYRNAVGIAWSSREDDRDGRVLVAVGIK